MIPIVSCIGYSNSGKTTLLEQVVRSLTSIGIRVGVIKHSPHGFELDHQGKDTWRFSQAGAGLVAVASCDTIATIEKVFLEPTPDSLKALFEGKVDIIITEGYKTSDTPKIVVLGADQNREELDYQGQTLATISGHLSPVGVPEFRAIDVLEVIATLARLVLDAQNDVAAIPKARKVA